MVRGFTAPAASSSAHSIATSNHASQWKFNNSQPASQPQPQQQQQQNKAIPSSSSMSARSAASASNALMNHHPDYSEKSNALSVISGNPLVGVGGSILSGDSVNGDEGANHKVNDINLSLKSSAVPEEFGNTATALPFNEQGRGQGQGQSAYATASSATTNEMRQPTHLVVAQVQIPSIYHENDSSNNTHQRNNNRTNPNNHHRPMTSIPLSHTVSSSSLLLSCVRQLLRSYLTNEVSIDSPTPSQHTLLTHIHAHTFLRYHR